MDRPTIEVYEREGRSYAVRRGVQSPDRTEAFAASLAQGTRRLDLGCGPGHYLPLLGTPAVATDAAWSMVETAATDHPSVPAVQADLTDLPFATDSFGGIWASKAHQHVAARDLPMALADIHRILEPGGRLDLTLFASEPGQSTDETVTTVDSGDDLPGRHFTRWNPDHLATVLAAAGLAVEHERVVAPKSPDGLPRLEITATARRALPDYVDGDMRLLCCGLNPSLHAADAGVGYVTGSNRFWKALAQAGISKVDRDPRRLLRQDRVGMTDLVKRPTPRAAALSTAEYRAGLDRLAALCRWLEPAAIVMVGLAGWRAAVDRAAAPGWQPDPLGPTPVYVMGSTSGLNARVSLEDLAAHFRHAHAGPS